MKHEVNTTSNRIFCDEYGRDYLAGWSGCSTSEEMMHACAVALNDAAEHYSDPSTAEMHPLHYLALLTWFLTDNALSCELAKAYAIFAQHAWRLDNEQIDRLASWSASLAQAAQAKRKT